MIKDQKKAYIYALSSVGIWSTVATAFKLSLRFTNVINLLFVASIISLIVLFLTIVYEKKLFLLKDITKKEIFYSALLGLLNPFLYYIVLFSAYDLLRAQEAQVINYTWAITLSVLAYFILGQSLSLGDILGLLLSYFGVFLIATKGNIFVINFQTSPKGILLALLSTIIWALYWVLNTRDRLEAVVRLFFNFLWGSLGICLVFLAHVKENPLNLYGVLGSIYIGLFEMGITFLLWSRALKFAKSTAKISILIYLSPFLSLIFIHYIIGEKIYLSTIFALFLIICGIGIQRIWNK